MASRALAVAVALWLVGTLLWGVAAAPSVVDRVRHPEPVVLDVEALVDGASPPQRMVALHGVHLDLAGAHRREVGPDRHSQAQRWFTPARDPATGAPVALLVSADRLRGDEALVGAWSQAGAELPEIDLDALSGPMALVGALGGLLLCWLPGALAASVAWRLRRQPSSKARSRS